MGISAGETGTMLPFFFDSNEFLLDNELLSACDELGCLDDTWALSLLRYLKNDSI